MSRGSFGSCLLAILAAAAGGIATAAPSSPGAEEMLRSVRPILDRSLDASGIGAGAEREAWAERFRERVLSLALQARGSRSDFRAARRLDRLLHDSLLRKYRFDADSLTDPLQRGEFNCVSAALVEGIA